MTREELQDYVQNCPYDAMGDFSVLLKHGVSCNQGYKHTDNGQTLQKNGVYEEGFFAENKNKQFGGDDNGD